MKTIHHLFLWIVIILISGYRCSSQTLQRFTEVEAYGKAVLNELLRENVVKSLRYIELYDGVTFKEQVNNPFTIYEIKNEFDLNSETITIPEHCVLVFKGGSLKNGTIIGNDTKYCSKKTKSQCLKCNVRGAIDSIGFVVKASDIGMEKDNEKSAKDNTVILKAIYDYGENIFLDGTYYFNFGNPIVLDRVMYLFGGELVYEHNAFRFSTGGGISALGVTIVASKKTRSAFFCGSKDLLGAISIEKLTFYDCTVDCGYLVNVLFHDINSDETNFGVNHLEVDHCVFENTGRIRIMDAVIDETCVFKNNYYKRFTTTPIYIACRHSIQTSPKDKSAYRFISQNLTKACPVLIDHNIFIGVPVNLNYYYCSALIKAKNCRFTNNYLQDIINYSSGSRATAYDTYLSCVNVVYENNYIKDMMSFSIDGGTKPQCQIGKSKTNPLSYWNYPAKRVYRNNIFCVNGERFLKMGADSTSLSADIFGNRSYIDEYVWESNSVVFKKAGIKTGVAAKSYGRFRLLNNYFEADDIRGGGLVTIRSNEKMNEIIITGNTFNVTKNQLLPLFNQKYYVNYKREDQESIAIVNNTFINCTPKIIFFTGEHVIVKNNSCDSSAINGNIYLSKYSGAGTVLDVSDMDAELFFKKQSPNEGGLIQFFSSKSRGEYSIELDQVPMNGVNYYYVIGQDHRFDLKLEIKKGESVQIVRIPFQKKGGKLSYEWEGKTINISSNKSDSKVWYEGDGVLLKTTFYAKEKNQIVTCALPYSSDSLEVIGYRFTYESK